MVGERVEKYLGAMKWFDEPSANLLKTEYVHTYSIEKIEKN
jgi:hypothetical protein